MASDDADEIAFNQNQISTTDDDDKKYVSQAVAFVIRHARNGFVSLCASVASLLKEQARLKEEIKSLRKQLYFSSQAQPDVFSKRDSLETKDLSLYNKVHQSITAPLPKEKQTISDLNRQVTRKIDETNKRPPKKSYRALNGCLCNSCSIEIGHSTAFSVPLAKGDKVVILGEICGTVCYVGHVDSLDFPEIFVGLQLDEKVGDTNGTIGGKTYFATSDGYGLFTSLSNICCLM